MSKENGGPAFPDPGRAQSQKQRELLGNEGMTLRDYFAAKASEEDIQYQRHSIKNVEYVTDGVRTYGLPINWRQIARYMHADAMLAERSKP